MTRRGFALVAISLVVLWGAVGYLQAGSQVQRPTPAPGAAAAAPAPVTGGAEPRALVDRYCVTCHNDRTKAGGLVLQGLNLADVTTHPDTWEKVVKKVRAGMMPPPGRPRPDNPTMAGFATYLETALDKQAALRVNPGRTEPFHRMNRTEYQNAVRDLLDVDVDVSTGLPSDAASYGFDNIGGVLKMSPTLMDSYLNMAQKISRIAVGTPPPVPTFDFYRIADDLQQDTQLPGLPDGTRGGVAVDYLFPMDGVYQFSPRLVTNRNEVPAYSTDQPLEVSIDGERVKVFTAPAADPAAAPAGDEYQGGRMGLDHDWDVRVPVKAGKRRVVVTFLNRNVGLQDNLREPFIKPFRFTLARAAALASLEISGPYDPTGPGETPGRKRVFVCHPARPSEEAACAKRILSTLARRAYRRPVTDEDVQPLLTFYEMRRETGGFEAGIEAGLKRLLVSPQFLFRVAHDPQGVAPGTPYQISDLDLASRMSFFLWSSIPDDELLNIAAKGQLRNPKVLEQQVRRMLADHKARAFVENFAGQWLYLRKVPFTTPDPLGFSDYDDSLRHAMREETELFMESILREDRPVSDLLTANYTFVNDRLARHYGIPDVAGPDFQRITLAPGSPRGGLLGHASILTVTSYPNRTSPVVRGAWLLENFLGTPPPPPPPDVPGLQDDAAGEKPKTLRERLAMHHRNPTCASCHSVMEPLGLALEHFDATGKYRPVAEGFSEIDATGTLPDGTPFDGANGLKQALLSKRDRFAATVTEKLMVYALGRGLESYDAPAVRTVVRNGAATNFRFASDIVLGVIKSVPFQMRTTATETTVTAAAR